MRLVIRDTDGKVKGCWVAKTLRGFNKKQKAEIAKVREQMTYGTYPAGPYGQLRGY